MPLAVSSAQGRKRHPIPSHLQAHMITVGDTWQVSQGIFWSKACDYFQQKKTPNIFWCF